ncbi:FeoB-associated Cys-rich membrane protein [Streptococcus dentapri]|uniref:FeoB-associated Cys-rich membrane protein n=1 Tax=Streptococcus dentapri TaxID=573564 RepID=A0ABV8D2F6_9STRE
MSTIIIATLIILAVLMGIRHYIKQKGSCGDCDCACPIKDEMQHAKKLD